MALPQTKQPIREDELLSIYAQEAYRHFEVVNGSWIGAKEQPMTGEEHGAIAAALQFILYEFVRRYGLGRVYPADLIYVLSGDASDIRTVRKPDVSFVSTAKLKQDNRDKPYYQAPDLAIEIVSPSESVADTRAKLNDYLQYGTQQVWVVYPKTKQVEIYLPDGTSQTYNANDTLKGGALLPNFSVKVADIFDV